MTGLTLGMLVAVAILGVRCADVAAQDARATVRATAYVSHVHDDDSDGPEAVGLTWTDSQGVEHVTIVQVGGRLALDSAVAVRYDPGNPGGLVFPAEEEAFPPPGDWQSRYLLALLATYVFLGVLVGARLALNVRAKRMPEASWRAMPLLVTYGSSLARWYTGYLRLVPPGDARGFVQRVYWHPALDRMPYWADRALGGKVLVRVGPWPFRRAVVTLPDGTRLWPAGRLRRRIPWGWSAEERPVGAPHHYMPTRDLIIAILALSALELSGFVDFFVGMASLGLVFGLIFFLWGWYGGEAICGDGWWAFDVIPRGPVQNPRGSSPRRHRRKKTPQQNRAS
ncbi:hypothetical protein [Nonomuraea guangzhouensis]|uniref:DUF3592 domain-containing protein n=1 Tax=Nonomuraea guangzhouensis TaxID=1291555 RepID=A0ABW4GZF0_9ACTN|nr:hypothetical protein [Nonomuraea guangzhouensis]